MVTGQDHKWWSLNNFSTIVGIVVFAVGVFNPYSFIKGDIEKLIIQFLGGLLTIFGTVRLTFAKSMDELKTLSEKILAEHRTERIFMPLNKFVEFGGIHKEVKDFPHEKLEVIANILDPVWTAIFERAGKQQTIRHGMSHELTIKKATVGYVTEARKDRKYELAIINHKISYKVTLKKGQPFLLAAPPILFVVNESLSSGYMLELERRGLAMFFTLYGPEWDTEKRDIATELKEEKYWPAFKITVSTLDENENLAGWKSFLTDRETGTGTVPYQRYSSDNADFDDHFNNLSKFFHGRFRGSNDSQDWYNDLINKKEDGNILSIVLPGLKDKLNACIDLDFQEVRVEYDVTYPLVIKSGPYTEYTYALPLENVSTLQKASMQLEKNSSIPKPFENPEDCFEMLPALLHHPLRNRKPGFQNNAWDCYSAKVEYTENDGAIMPGNGIVFGWKPKKDSPLLKEKEDRSSSKKS